MTTLLSGKYRVEEEIARGGMGTLYKGVHTALGRPVAIKALHPEYGLDPDFRRRFLREARALARLDHPHVIRVFDVEEDEVGQYLIMELFPGRDLKKLVRERGRLPAEEVLSIGAQVADALAYAHSREIIHRDIKPGNILIDDAGHVKLVDFGIAAGGGEVSVTKAGQILGTPQYMAPEQARGEKPDERTDLYALGIVLYELLMGRTPYHGLSQFEVFEKLLTDREDRVLEFDSEVPRRLEDLIRKLLGKRKVDRPKSARAVSTEIGSIAEGGSSAPDEDEDEPEPEPEPELQVELEPEPQFSFAEVEDDLRDGETTQVVPRTGWWAFRRVVVAGSSIVALVGVVAAGVFWWRTTPPVVGPDVESPPTEVGGKNGAGETTAPRGSETARFPEDRYLVVRAEAALDGGPEEAQERARKLARDRMADELGPRDEFTAELARAAGVRADWVRTKWEEIAREVAEQVRVVEEPTAGDAFRGVAVLEREEWARNGEALLGRTDEQVRSGLARADRALESGDVTSAIRDLVAARNAAVDRALIERIRRRVGGDEASPDTSSPAPERIVSRIREIFSEDRLRLRPADEMDSAVVVSYAGQPVSGFPVSIARGDASTRRAKTNGRGIVSVGPADCSDSDGVVFARVVPDGERLFDASTAGELDRLVDDRGVRIADLPPACSETCDRLREGGGATPRRQTKRVIVELNRAVFREGDELRLDARMVQDSFLYILTVYEDRSVALLFPNRRARNNRFGASSRIAFPEDYRPIRLRVVPPPGVDRSAEKVVLLATEKRLPVGQEAKREAGRPVRAREFERALMGLDGEEWAEASIAYCVLAR